MTPRNRFLYLDLRAKGKSVDNRSKKKLEHDIGHWQSTDNISRLLDNSPDSMFVSRLDDFQFTNVNERAIENYGYSREEFLQMQIFDIEVIAPLREEVRQLYNATPVGEVIEVEGLNKRKDGSTFPVNVRFCKLDDEYAVANVRDITQQKQAAAEFERRVITERNRLEEEILKISDRERRRVGQDLHDDLGQHLTGIGFMAEELEQSLGKQGMTVEARKVGAMVNLVEEAKVKTRNLVQGLYPIELESDGLLTAIQNLATQTEKVYGVSCFVSVDQHLQIGNAGIGESLYHIAQEAITNAVRHGQPTRIDLELRQEDGQLIMAVEDNGCGLPDDYGERDGMGIRIMRYRARVINGRLEVEHTPGGGTIVKCLVSGVSAMPLTEDSK